MEENRPKQTRRFPTQAVLTIRVIVGAYVMYLAYQIVTSGEEKPWYIFIFVVLFVVVGILMIAFSLKHLILGEYDGGKADHYEEDNAEEEEVISSVEAAVNTGNKLIEEQDAAEAIEENKIIG